MIAAARKTSAISLIGMLLLTVCRPAAASQALDMTITANLLDDHCAIQVEPATVVLPTVEVRTLEDDPQTPTPPLAWRSTSARTSISYLRCTFQSSPSAA